MDHIAIVDFGVELYDFYLHREEREPISVSSFLRAKLDEIDFQPDVVGISLLFASSHTTVMELAEIAKEKWSKCKTIFGGNQASNIYKELLENKHIDYVARGEAELSFTEFIDNLKKGNTDFDICGIFDKKKAKKNICETSEMLQDLTEIPLPAFDLVKTEFYKNTVGGSVMWTRGCPFRCTFCATTTVHGRTMRYKSNEQCLEEIRYLISDLGFKKIFVEDDLFAAKKKDFIELSKEIAKIRKDCIFGLPQGISVAVMDEDRVEAMMEMGISQAAVAIESGSPYVQKHIMKKNVNLDKARKLLAHMRKVGFRAHTNFILGSPKETDEMRQEFIDYMKTLDVNWIYIFHALPLPGSEMFNQFQEVTDMRTVDWDTVRLGMRKFDTSDISAKSLEELVYDTNIEVNFFENSNFRHERFELAVNIWTEFILTPFPYHIVARYCRALAYEKLGRLEEMKEDLLCCLEWIKENQESKRLFERYKNRMPLLVELENTANQRPAKIEFTKTLSGGRVVPGENI